jgi:hypothetical protein
MSARRVSVTIDRIVTDDPTLSRAALIRALEAEVRARLAAGQPLGAPGARESASVSMDRGKAPAAERVARAALRRIAQ